MTKSYNINDKDLIDELKLMLIDMEKASDLYRPTHYWKTLFNKVLSEQKKYRSHNLKNHPHFIPKFRTRFYKSGLKEKFWDLVINILEKSSVNFLNRIGRFLIRNILGYSQAYEKFLIFNAADHPDIPPVIRDFSESLEGGARERRGYYAKINNKIYSKGSLKYLRGIAFLKKTIQEESRKIVNILEIGGGFGSLGEIMLKAGGGEYFYVNVDIPPMAHVSSNYLKMVFGKDKVLSYEDSRLMKVIDINSLKSRYKAIVLCPWQLENIVGKFDLFVNFTSFQEMEPDVVKNYCKLVNNLVSGYVLLMNRTDGQKLAKSRSERGVLKITTMNDIVKNFDEFQVRNRNQDIFGDPAQEVVVLSR